MQKYKLIVASQILWLKVVYKSGHLQQDSIICIKPQIISSFK